MGNKIIESIRIKNLIVFLALFLTIYILLDIVYSNIIHICFKDVFTHSHPPYRGLNRQRLTEVTILAFFKNFIIIGILILLCIYVKKFKNAYFKESIFAFAIFIVVFCAMRYIFKIW